MNLICEIHKNAITESKKCFYDKLAVLCISIIRSHPNELMNCRMNVRMNLERERLGKLVCSKCLDNFLKG